VPTADGYLFAAASAVIEGQLWKGGSVSVPGEPDVTTDLGSFYLTPGGIGQVLLPPDFLPLQRSVPWIDRRFGAPVCRAALGGL